MKNFLEKYFGDKTFYKKVFAVALPIMLQNGISTFVSLLDNIMVGQIGTEPMSGVAIVNQLIFVFNLTVFGLMSGIGIFTAQFHGKKDEDGVRMTFRTKLISAFVLSVLFVLALYFFQDQLIGLYLTESSAEGDLLLTLRYGKDYLWIILIGLIPFALTQVYSSTLRETEHTVVPMIAGIIAVAVNTVGNYLLIFGKIGLPVLGVQGAAIATVLSRFVELIILVAYAESHRKTFGFIKGAYRHLFSIDKKLLKDIVLKGFPLMFNEMLWSAGMSALAQCYSVRGLSVVAGYNIATTIIDVFKIFYVALGNAIGIIIGVHLGAKENEKAYETGKKLSLFSIVMGVAMGLCLVGAAFFVPSFYNTTSEVKTIAFRLMCVAAVYMPWNSYLNACYFILRSGGKTWITFFFDSVTMLVMNFPMAFCLAHFTGLAIIPMYILVSAMDLIKCVIGFILFRKKIWIHQIV